MLKLETRLLAAAVERESGERQLNGGSVPMAATLVEWNSQDTAAAPEKSSLAISDATAARIKRAKNRGWYAS